MNHPRISYLETEHQNGNANINLKRPNGVGFLRFAFAIAQRIAPKWAANQALAMFVTPRIRAQHGFQDELVSGAEKHEILYNDKKIRVYRWKGGEKNAVLVHGWESRATALRIIVPQLIDEGYTVYGVDAPAHGESEGKHTNLVEYAEIIRLAAQKFGDFNLGIAHSFGGLALTYACANFPNFKLNKIAILGMPATTKLALQTMYRMLHIEHNVQALLEQKISDTTGYLVENLSVAHLVKTLNDTEGLLFHDEKDNLVPLYVAIETVNEWDNSKLFVTHGLGHYKIIKSKEVQEKLFQWVKNGEPETEHK